MALEQIMLRTEQNCKELLKHYRFKSEESRLALKNELLICHRFFEDPLTIPYRAHAHEKWEFLFVTKGIGLCMIEGKRYAIKEKTLMVFRPAQIHRVQASGNQPYEYFSFMCEESLLSLQSIQKFSDGVGILTFNNPERIQRIFSWINAQYQNNCLDFTLNTKLLMVEELMQSITEEEQQNNAPILLAQDAIVNAAVSFIRDNVHAITRLDQICDAVGVTKERLYGHFIQNMLISPMKYVRAKRTALAKAASLDAETRMDVLRKYGFKNEESFDKEYASFYRSVP